MMTMNDMRFRENEIGLGATSFDGEEINIHDQLPLPEEIFLPVKTSRNFRRTCVVLIAFTLFLASIGLAIGVAVKEKENSPQAKRTEETFAFLANHTDPETLLVSNSPQRRAAVWMAQEDALQIEIPVEGKDEWKFLQRYALVVLYFATQDKGPWTFPQLQFATPKRHECNWSHPFQRSHDGSTFTMGVICSDEKQVTKLIIDGNGLSGELPPELSLLQHVTRISLGGNDIVGTLPPALQKLKELSSLSMTYNSIQGSIPSWIGQLTNLVVLGLSNNDFHGHIPFELTALSGLKILALDDNHLVGNFSHVAQLTQLEELYLESNIFTGTLDSLSYLNNLQILDVSSNRLGGDVPTALFHQSNLRILDLHDNKLEGTFPEDISLFLSNLTFLALHDNFLTGSIPTSIHRLSMLKHLDMATNRLDGNVTTSIAQLTHLEYLVLANNPHLDAGPLPDLSSLTNLSELSFRNTNRTGAIPQWVGNLSQLTLLDLDQNHFVGEIPTHIGHLQHLELLFLNRNNLTGALPTQMERLTNLALFAMDKNSITGTAGPLCDLLNLQVFISDCAGDQPEFECPCCSKCCHDNDAECNKDFFLVSYDPTWEDGYERDEYIFPNGIALNSTKPSK